MPRSERDINVDVTIRSDTKGADRAAAGLGKVDKAADRAGKSLGDMSADADLLDAEVGGATKSIRDLDKALLHLSKARNQANLSLINKGGGGKGGFLLDLVDGAADAGKKAGRTFTEGFGAATDLGGPHVKGIMVAGLVGAATAAAPLAGAVIAGGISGAIGTGGMAAGLIAASRDPRVQAAGKEFAESVSAEFTKAGGPFVEPAIDALKTLDQAVKDFDIAGSLKPLAETVPVIAEGVKGFAEAIKPAVDEVMPRMIEFANVAGPGIAYLGDALGSFMDSVTESPGAISGLTTAFGIAGEAVKNFGWAINTLSDVFNGYLHTSADVLGALADFEEAIGAEETAAGLRRTAEGLDHVANKADRASGSWRGFASLPDINKNITITEHRRILSEAGATGGRGLGSFGSGGGKFPGFASGGTTPAFQPFEVHAGETMWSDKKHYVASAAQTRALGTGAGAATQTTIRVIVEDRTSGGVRARAIEEGLRRGIPEATLRAAYP